MAVCRPIYQFEQTHIVIRALILARILSAVGSISLTLLESRKYRRRSTPGQEAVNTLIILCFVYNSKEYCVSFTPTAFLLPTAIRLAAINTILLRDVGIKHLGWLSYGGYFLHFRLLSQERNHLGN